MTEFSFRKRSIQIERSTRIFRYVIERQDSGKTSGADLGKDSKTSATKADLSKPNSSNKLTE